VSYEPPKEFCTQLLALRTRAGLTQGALADAVGVHRRSVQNWEAGITYPKAEALQRLLVVLVQQRALAPEHELAEAKAFWELAADHAGLSFPTFDAAWLSSLLATGAASGVGQQPTEQHARTARLLDWGEAIAVPIIYGRDRELATLQQWLVVERCRMVLVLGLGGIGKSSLAIRAAEQAAPHFAFVLFRSLQNAPPLADLLDHLLNAVSGGAVAPAAPPELVTDKVALLVQRFREQRCLLILDNFETVLEPGTLSGTYRDGYADYGGLLQALSAREHQSCLVLTSREKPIDLAPFEGLAAPVRTLVLGGLAAEHVHRLLEHKDVTGTATAIDELTHVFGGNPLALRLVAEPIHELFGGDVTAFLAAGNAFFHSVGALLAQQFARSTALEQVILYWLAVERELLPLSTLQARLSDTAPSRTVLAALESLRRRMLIERGPDEPAFTLQPVIMEFVTSQLEQVVPEELVSGTHRLLRSHSVVQATAKEYVRRSQERLIATPILERLDMLLGERNVEPLLLDALSSWRTASAEEAGYGPGNVVNLLRLRRGQLSGLDLSRLAIRQGFFQGLEMHETSLAHATLHDCRFTDTFGSITAISISGDGAYWAASSKCGELRVWLAGAQVPYRVWQAHSDSTWNVAFSPGEHTLASCSWDGTVKLWDIEANAMRWSARLPGHVQRVAFAPHGRLIASCGGGAAVWLLDAQSGARVHTLEHPSVVVSIAWSPEGGLLATGDRAGNVRLWRVDGPAMPVCTHELGDHTNLVQGLAFDPSGRTLATASWDGTVRLWEVATASVQRVLEGYSGRITQIAWSGDGAMLAASGSDRTIWLWDVARQRYRAALREHSSSVLSLAFARGDRYLVSGSEDGTLRVWELASEQCVRVIEGYAILLYEVSWSPDGQQLVSGGADGAVTIWDTSSIAQPRVVQEHQSSVHSVSWSPDGRWVASSEWGAAIWLHALAPDREAHMLQPPADVATLLYGLAWSPDGRRLACGTHRRGLQLFELAGEPREWPRQTLPCWIRRVAWRPDGSQIAGCGDNGVIYIWDAEGALLRQLRGHSGMVADVAWSPDGARIASCSLAEGELFVWEAEGERVQPLFAPAVITTAVTWDPSGGLLVSGGKDGSLRWWDVTAGRCVRVEAAHKGTVTALRCSPDGTTLASCGVDGQITLWDMPGAMLRTSFRRKRPYEHLDITGLAGVSAAQRLSLQTLGAAERSPAELAVAGDLGHGPAAHGRAQQHPPARLPRYPTAFVGRDDEIAAISRILAVPGCRLLTLLGPGGIGKTRLAVEVAAAQGARFANGAALVDLSSVDQPGLLVSAIAEALSLLLAEQGDPAAQLVAQLGERHMLLVLDNFEQLVESAELLTAILAGAPRITIVVTSRLRLDLQAEWIFDVEGLTYPVFSGPAAEMPSHLVELTGYSAVQLFVQRARQIQPRLELSAATLAAIARICEQVAGVPLAIELAARSVRTTSVAEVEQQLRRNLDALTISLRDLPARHRSMRAAFDHSWDLLTEPERALWSRLAIFRGGWTLEAAEQVVGATMPELMALVDWSLVRQGEAARFRMLEPIREYALERLAAHEDGAHLRRRHARYYATLAASARVQLTGPQQTAWMQRLGADHDNLRAALDWSLREHEAELGLGLGAALASFWQIRGHVAEGRERLHALLAAFAQPLDQRVAVLLGAIMLAGQQGDHAQARRLADEMLGSARALGAAAWIAEALAVQGKIAQACDEVPAAVAFFEEAMALHRGEGNTRGVANMLLNLGRARLQQGALAEAGQHFAASLALYRQLGDSMGIIYNLLHQGVFAAAARDSAQMSELGGEVLRLAWSSGYAAMIGYSLELLGAAALVRGQVVQGVRLLAASSRTFDDSGHAMQPPEQERSDYWRQVARASLGAATYAKIWEAGYALSREAVVAEALGSPLRERAVT
jgi:WD40 repeat protein/predicted ATPase/transcriptional regulator with XRE-family HTH domain